MLSRKKNAPDKTEWETVDGDERLPQPLADETRLPAPARRIPLLDTLRQRLPRFSDGRQKQAMKNLIRFFVLVLVLTLVARGTAGATLPRVETARAQSGEIVQQVRGTGTVKASGSITLDVPDGLTVQQVPASPGQNVAPGDIVAQFDADELGEQLRRETNALKELQQKLHLLQQNPATDTSALEAAHRALARAQQDYGIAATQGQAELAAAQQELANAEAAAQQAQDLLAGITDQTSQEYKDAYADWLAKSGEIPVKREALAQTQARVDASLLAASRAVEDAQTALANAEKADADAKKQAQDTAAQNNLEADTLQLDISAQQKKVALLQTLVDNDGQLRTTAGGIVQQLPQPGSKTGVENPFQLADTSGGFEAELWLDKKDAEKLAPGDACEVALSGGSMYYRPTAEGHVTSVGTPGEDGRTKVTVRLPEGDWKAGQTVETQVVQSKQTHSLCVPLSAIRSSSEGYYILVLQQQNTVLGLETIAAKIPVTVTAQDEQTAAIEGPLSGQEDIITTTSKAVQPNDKVRVAS